MDGRGMIGIQQTLHRLTIGLDEEDFEMFGDCFTHDAVYSSSGLHEHISGRAAITEYFRTRRATRRERGEQPRHIVTNVLVLDETDRAVAVVAYVSNLVTSERGAAAECGWWRERLVHEEGIWRIIEHYIHSDATGPEENALRLD